MGRKFFPFSKILNTLREDSQQIICDMLVAEEKIEKCWICLYNEALQPFRECQRSLDSNAATTVVNLRIASLIFEPGAGYLIVFFEPESWFCCGA